MAQRGVTKEMVETWVATGKAIQQYGDKFLMVTKEGETVITKAGKLVYIWRRIFDISMQDMV